MSIICWFKELSQNDISTAGAKAAKMGELVNARFPIPEGFVLTTDAYKEFLDLGGLRQQISEKLADLDYENAELLNSTSEEISSLILSTQMPSGISREIKNAYQELCMKKDIIISGKIDIPVRITTSNIESPPLDGIRGASEVAKTIQKLWASLYLPENLKKFKGEGKQPISAVLVQKLIMSEKSGLMRGEGERILIKAGWGLVDAVKSQGILADKYAVSENEIVGKEINDQDWMYRGMPDGTRKKTEVLGSQRNIQKLTDQEILKLAGLYASYSSYTSSLAEIEWSIVGRDVFILHEDAEEQETQVPDPQPAAQTEYSPPGPEPDQQPAAQTEYSPPGPEPEPQPAPEQPASEQDSTSILQPISEYQPDDTPLSVEYDSAPDSEGCGQPQYESAESNSGYAPAEYAPTETGQSEYTPSPETSYSDVGLLIRDPAAALTLEGKLDGRKYVLVDADALASKIVPDNPRLTNGAVLELMRQIVRKCKEKEIRVVVTGGFTREDLEDISQIGFDHIFSVSA